MGFPTDVNQYLHSSKFIPSHVSCKITSTVLQQSNN